MTIDEAIKAYDEVIANYAADLIDNHCVPEVQREFERQYQLFVMGRDALCAQREQSNEPLTLDDLREMDGEPIFVVSNNSREWCILRVVFPDVWAQSGGSNHCAISCSTYGKTWLAYRRKLEKEG